MIHSKSNINLDEDQTERQCIRKSSIVTIQAIVALREFIVIV
jgi:hypothetical protein